MSFELNGRRFFLTYSQADIDSDALHDFLGGLKPLHRAIISREHHADGGRHSHVAVEYTGRLQTRRADYFDYEGIHPNVQPARTWAAVVKYVRKDGDVKYYNCTEHDAVLPGARGGHQAQQGEDVDGAKLFLACEGCTSFRQWLIVCLERKVTYAYCKAVWDCSHGRRAPTFTERPGGGIIGNFELSIRHVGDGTRTIVICGPSGIGKTTWALREAPLPFLLVTDIDDLGDFDPAVHKSIVFDEIRCTGDAWGKGCWPLTSQIKLVTWDTPVSIRVRYKVAHLPANVVKIFTCTDTLPFTRDEQIERRIDIVNLYGENHCIWTSL